MAAFVDQVAETLQWTDETRTSLTAEFPALARVRREPDPRHALRQADRRTALLNRVVETEVLPRLLLAQRAARPRPPASKQLAQDTTELVRLVLAQDATSAAAFMERLQSRGATAESLYLGVLTGAARRLGDLWLADQADFMQVTIATGRLQQLLRMLAPGFQAAAARHRHPYAVMLMPAPGEQHTFGLLMLGEFFRRSGWHVVGGPGASPTEPVDSVRRSWIDVAAFSIGSETLLARLVLLINRVRRASRNPGLRVMVGGPLFFQFPDLARRVGADAAAADAPAAVGMATDMLTMRAAAE
jgi:MerR family transcriptional regulator, light-induced transcriptional regulator